MVRPIQSRGSLHPPIPPRGRMHTPSPTGTHTHPFPHPPLPWKSLSARPQLMLLMFQRVSNPPRCTTVSSIGATHLFQRRSPVTHDADQRCHSLPAPQTLRDPGTRFAIYTPTKGKKPLRLPRLVPSPLPTPLRSPTLLPPLDLTYLLFLSQVQFMSAHILWIGLLPLTLHCHP
jgi:hypothetical protein